MPNKIAGKGWIPDYPDHRDYTVDTNRVRPLLQRVGIADIAAVQELPENRDLRQWCPPIEDQGQLGSCSAHAAIALVEFFERRTFGTHLDASRLFLYKVTRNLTGCPGDCGATLRDTMKALVLFGVPPEEHWDYTPDYFDAEPEAFHYAFAQNYQAEVYYRLNPFGASPEDLLHCIKVHLANELPLAFGFTTYASMDVASNGHIPFPEGNESATGAHAVAAVGYNNRIVITHPTSEETTTGALLIRNSWGTDWGEEGYGWMPYDYVLRGLTSDWWALLRNEWVDPGAIEE